MSSAIGIFERDYRIIAPIHGRDYDARRTEVDSEPHLWLA
jgi:hypothetical protein